ncbi:restriction endonuclease [Streptomyces sp. NPDC001388]|uniref:restriction endonuclease n=1 Tax=Streptomyces sp. NPDC001388 TaxID=3364568 RepID=UPI0036CD3424
MTVPTRPLPPVRRRRRFDLRATALFFVLLALLLSLGGLIARLAAAAAERRPAWAFTLLLLTSAGIVACHRGRRRRSARRLVREAAEALEEAAETAVGALDEAPVATPVQVAEDTPRTSAVATVEETLVLTTDHVPDFPGYEALDPDEFEQAIADLCARDGCAGVEVVGGAGDLGADVTAMAPNGHRLVIQCKRYGDGHKVGSQDLQRFGGTCFTVHEADIAVVVTTSDFTAPAVEYAQQCGIVCVDAEGLRAWHSGSGPRPWERPDEG